MKLQTKINIFVFNVLLLLGLAIMIITYAVINQAITELYEKQLSSELKNINQEITQAHQVIKDASVLDVEESVKVGKQQCRRKVVMSGLS